MTLPTIEKYARAIQNEVGTEGVWGFIDGTMRPFCRPGENQEQYYSGHKKNHGFQFQCIMTPDGLMSSLHGPYTGPTADWNMWKDSELEGQLRAIFLNEDARAAAEQPEGIQVPRYYLYGDLAYWPAFGIMGPFRPQNAQGVLSREGKAANLAMLSVRITVEWGFGMNVNLWGINNYK